MTNRYERPDPSAPPENKYAPEYPRCPECGEEIKDAVDEIVDCIDHLPIDVLPEVLEAPPTDRYGRLEQVEYNRCLRALDRAVKALKEKK